MAATGPSLLVSSRLSNQVLQYSLPSGTFFAALIGPGAGDSALLSPYGIKVGPDGKIYVASYGNNRVLRYNADGSFDTIFAQGNGLSSPQGIVFDSAGKLYISNSGSDNVLRFNADGTFDRIFATGNGLTTPVGITFGPDGKLYVVSKGSSQILAWNADGTFASVFASVLQPSDLLFDVSNNRLLVSAAGAAGDPYSTGSYVQTRDGTTGAFIQVLCGAGPLNLALGLALDLPNDRLYVSSTNGLCVYAYDYILTGAFVSVFASGGGLTYPTFLTIM